MRFFVDAVLSHCQAIAASAPRCTTLSNAKIAFSVIATALSALTAFAGPVADYGRLYKDGNKLIGANSAGETVQLKGTSLQWSVTGWGSDRFFRTETVNALVDGWSAQIIRVPLGVDFNKSADHHVENGYKTKPDENWNRVRTVVDAAVARGVYAIVDWHSHTAHEPAETRLAIDFFTNPTLAGKYGNNPAVIFEIYNEPEDDVTWPEVKAYADTVIAAIRGAGFDNLILVGSHNWDLSVDIAAAAPPSDPLDNFALALHFYAAGAHQIDTTRWFNPRKTHRKAVQDALAAGIPVFVTEWGTNDATSETPPNFAEADKWHAFLNENKLSSCAWGVTASDYNVLDYWTASGNPLSTTRDPAALSSWTNPRWMTPHGRYIYRLLTGRDTTYTIDGPEFPEYDGPHQSIPLTDALTASANDASTASRVIDENGIMRVAFELNSIAGGYEWDPYALVYYEIDLSQCGWGIGYTYKGIGNHTIRIEQSDVDDNNDYAYHANSVELADVEDWTEVRVPWYYFEQPDWTEADNRVNVNITKIRGISWYTEDKAGTAGEYYIKDVQCLGYGLPQQSSVRPNRGAASVKGAGQFVRVSGRTLTLHFEQIGRVDIYDLKGSKIRTMKLKQGSHAIKMNNLPKGMYIVRARSGASWNKSVKMFIK